LNTFNATRQLARVDIYALFYTTCADADTEGSWDRTNKCRRECFKCVEGGGDARMVLFQKRQLNRN
jgi:hypothetical protein